jgi:hypothetical protein
MLRIHKTVDLNLKCGKLGSETKKIVEYMLSSVVIVLKNLEKDLKF